MTSAAAAAPSAADREILQALNLGYVRAAETSDVRWFDEHLGEDFMASSVDGSLVDKAAFLARMARPYTGSQPEAVDPRIRFVGELALVHAGFRYRGADGTPGSGRYTDVYTQREGRWVCISAHFNRF